MHILLYAAQWQFLFLCNRFLAMKQERKPIPGAYLPGSIVLE
jgi:hypothetical protein